MMCSDGGASFHVTLRRDSELSRAPHGDLARQSRRLSSVQSETAMIFQHEQQLVRQHLERRFRECGGDEFASTDDASFVGESKHPEVAIVLHD